MDGELLLPTYVTPLTIVLHTSLQGAWVMKPQSLLIDPKSFLLQFLSQEAPGQTLVPGLRKSQVFLKVSDLYTKEDRASEGP